MAISTRDRHGMYIHTLTVWKGITGKYKHGDVITAERACAKFVLCGRRASALTDRGWKLKLDMRFSPTKFRIQTT